MPKCHKRKNFIFTPRRYLTERRRVFDFSNVASDLASCGSIDIKPYGKRTALVATNSKHTVDRILRRYTGSNEYRISTYNAYRHSVAGRMAIWSGALLTGSLMLLFIRKVQLTL